MTKIVNKNVEKDPGGISPSQYDYGQMPIAASSNTSIDVQ